MKYFTKGEDRYAISKYLNKLLIYEKKKKCDYAM